MSKADTLVLGHIVTLDPRNPILEALTVKDGIITYAGRRDYARQLCDEHTKVLDYGENYVYPGFIDGHCHGSIASTRLLYFADLTSGQTMAEYVDIMKAYMEKYPDLEHFWGAGWEERDQVPTREMLDRICPDKPMCMNSVDGHSMWMNTPALAYFGIDDDCAKKWGPNIIRLGADGKPTGYISEGPATEISVKMNHMDLEAYKKALLVWQDYALSYGITAYYEAGCVERVAQAYTELIREGKWKLRVYAGWLVDERSPDYVAEVRKAKEMADKYNCEYFKIIGLKIFMDGVVEAHTGWMLEEYADQPGYTGIKRFCDLDRTVELYKEAAKYGFNVHQHTIGDGAVKFALDCIEKAQLETGCMDMRNAMAHLQLMRPEDIRRSAALNVINVVAPLWMRKEASYYEQTERYIGKKRAFYQYPLKSIQDAGGILAFHTDYPVSPAMSVPKSIYCAAERNYPDEDFYYQLNAHEALDRMTAIYAMTIGPAYECKEEDTLGRLMIGYTANMSVFDKNFLTDDIHEVGNAKLVATLIDGTELYRAKA